jgi:hypothetical protein
MSLLLFLAALQSEETVGPPPIQIKPVVPVSEPPPSTGATPGVIYKPAPKPEDKLPAASPGVVYTPAAKAAPATPASKSEAPADADTFSQLSEAARKRIAAERQLNTERVAAHRRELAAAQAAVGKALAAEPFDMAALKSALLNRDKVASSYRERLTAAVFEMLDDISPEERVIVARAVIEGELPPPAQPAKPKPSPTGR